MLSYIFYYHFCTNMYVLRAFHLRGVGKEAEYQTASWRKFMMKTAALEFRKV